MKAAFSDVELDEKEYRFVGELNSQAYTYASQTDEWKNIRSEWWTCLRERGLTPGKERATGYPKKAHIS